VRGTTPTQYARALSDRKPALSPSQLVDELGGPANVERTWTRESIDPDLPRTKGQVPMGI